MGSQRPQEFVDSKQLHCRHRLAIVGPKHHARGPICGFDASVDLGLLVKQGLEF